MDAPSHKDVADTFGDEDDYARRARALMQQKGRPLRSISLDRETVFCS